MRVLAIETSCDETGVSILEGTQTGEAMRFTVLGTALLSQAALHAPYGGVYPNLAKREHEKNLPVILEQATRAAGEACTGSIETTSEKKSSGLPSRPDAGQAGQTIFSEVVSTFQRLSIDAIAVTSGPGLEPALWTGITFAKRLAKETGLPLMGVNHMEGHLISSLARQSLGNDGTHSHILENGGVTRCEIRDVRFPVLGLLISGGHTEFVLMKDWFDYEIVGKTLDDAVGEAFDKVARLLELPYPGGPHISRIADEARKKSGAAGGGSGISQRPLDDLQRRNTTSSASCNITLPRPMLKSKNCDMSFSGLKTAALYALRGKTLSDDEKAAFAREFEDTVGDVFVAKTRKALLETGARTFVIGGGVAANRYLRERLQALLLEEFDDIECRLPDVSITGDNAVMIAEAALVHMLKEGVPTDSGEDIRAVGGLSLSSK